MGNSLLFKACPDTIVDPRETLCYDPHTQITHPTILCHDKRNKSQSYVMTCYDTLVVEVTAIVNEDDACSMAVYFGPRSRFNRRAVKDGCDWRSGMAFVVFEALTNALKVRSKVSHRINRVLVMADDEHLIDVLTSDTPASDLGSVMIGQIRRRIYESAREGIKVSELQCCLDVIYSSNQVKFWLVRPRAGTEVDRMATEVLPERQLQDPASPSTTPNRSDNRANLVESPSSYLTEDIPELDLVH